MLEVNGLGFGYNGRRVFSGVSFAVRRGEVLCVLGPNGAGKTTLLKCVVRVLAPLSGEIQIDHRDASAVSRMELARLVSYLPQNVKSRFPMLVFETVLSGRRPHFAWRPSPEDFRKASAIINEMDLSELAMKDVSAISGGQAQKVLLARALAQEADFLVLDEPTSNLDLKHQLTVLETVRKLASERKMGVVMAMHDLSLAARFADRVLLLHDGRAAAFGSPQEVMTFENIRSIYGVEAEITQKSGRLYIQALKCVEN